MSAADDILRTARGCHTKEAWESLFQEYSPALSSMSESRILGDLFHLLEKDPQSTGYAPFIWSTLISGCLSAWDPVLGRRIVQFAERIPSAQIAIPSAELLMQSGSPSLARQTAGRALRLVGITPREKLRLQIIMCNSYVEEGKHGLALRLLDKMEEAIQEASFDTASMADFLINLARTQFFLGRYNESGQIFRKAYHLYLSEQNWEAGARALFNTAACYHNSGQDYQKAFAMIDECMALAREHQLNGALAHCYAFYGTDDYQRGRMTSATRNFKRALENLPQSEESFRFLTISSMLTFTYIRRGQYQKAKKYGRQTLELARKDKSERFRYRYKNLEAELLWYEGRYQTSQELLHGVVKNLYINGVSTLEELSTLNRYLLQCAFLDEKNTGTNLKIADQLTSHAVQWADYLFSISQLYLTQGRLTEAEKAAEQCMASCSRYGFSPYRSLALLTKIQIRLAAAELPADTAELVREFEAISSRTADTPIDTHIFFIRAAMAYKAGQQHEVRQILQQCQRLKTINNPLRFLVDSWLATMDGQSPRLNTPEKVRFMARATRVYFRPVLFVEEGSRFEVSDRFKVELANHPILDALLQYLLARENYAATPEELQENVWGQSIRMQGWNQKIRNTIKRIRHYFPDTMAPIIIHTGNQVRLYSEAIQVNHHRRVRRKTDQEILHALKFGPMSTEELAGRVSVSRATAKRALKSLTEQAHVVRKRQGRHILYSITN